MRRNRRREGPFVYGETVKERMRRELREGKRELTLERRRMLFAGALAAERLGPHPGRVEVRIEMRIYDPVKKQYRLVPGVKIEMAIESAEGLTQARDAAERGIRAWMDGKWDEPRGRLKCECGEVL